MLQPLPVFLHGPSLFELGGGPGRQDPQEQARAALTQIILGLHRAVTREFARAYRERLIGQPRFAAAPDEERRDFAELAARFDLELAGDPTAEQLHDFWALAEALDEGVLARPVARDQGRRELVALIGICEAFRRISGELSSALRTQQGLQTQVETRHGIALKGSEFVRPVVSVLAGVAIAGVGGSLIGGLAAALASSLMFSRSRSRSETDSRRSDTTFIPDLSLNTLDRVLPTLLQRLRDAGLAPVLVVDELDKVERLSQRLDGMVRYLKKLVAENVFTCFLTDRGYLEQLRLETQGAYSLSYSYFSQPLLVSFRPADFDDYLSRLLRVPAQDQEQQAQQTVDSGDLLDLEVLKWVLRHRSELHALTLNREIALLRGDGGALVLERGHVRTLAGYRIAVTFQVLIELQLAQPSMAAWLRLRPERGQTVVDALYFLSRCWAVGERAFRWGDTVELDRYLRGRMNLEADAEEDEVAAARVLPPDDLKLLKGVLDDMVALLSPHSSAATLQQRWSELPAEPGTKPPRGRPTQAVFDAMLLGPGASLLTATDEQPPRCEWRYRPSGVLRDPPPRGPLETFAEIGRQTDAELEAALLDAQRIRDIEDVLKGLLQSGREGVPKGEEVFELLAEKLRLLPTSPAWQPVRAAIAQLQHAKANPALAFNLKEQRSAVKDFADMLEESRPALAAALQLAGHLAGSVYALSEMSTGLRHALTLVSEALRFEQLAGARIVDMVGRLAQELPGFGLQGDEFTLLAPRVHAAFAEGKVRGGTGTPQDRGARAWDAARATLQGQDVQPEAVSAAEILAALVDQGPYPVLGFHFEMTTLAQWSDALMRALHLVGGEDAAAAPVPVWVIAPALRRLGAASITAAAVARVVEWLSPGLGTLLSDEPPGRIGRGGSERVALCVVETADSPMRAWTQPPRLGFALVVDLDRALHLLGGRRFEAMGLSAVIARDGERPASRKPLLPDGAGREVLVPQVWVYRRRQASMRKPSLVEPMGADEALDLAGALPS